MDEYIPETDPALDLPELSIPINIKPPGRVRLAPSPENIDDSTYIPAASGEGLEEVGSVADWWENDKHWAPSMNYVGFSRREKITDAAVLEAMTRRAVVETLAVKHIEGDRALTGTWMTGGREAMLKALAVDVQVSEDGAVSLTGDLQAVVEGLKPAPQAEVQEIEPEVEQLERQEGLETAQETAVQEEDAAVVSDQEAYSDVLPSEDAHQLRKSWGNSWKSVSIEDPTLKFALNKRIQQLTGHIINDAKLITVRNVASYLSVLVKPPPPKKLVELLERKGDLPSLPNVKVYPRRVTPVDKERMVGRWKVIVNELQKRDLPVTGTAGYSKTPEKKWAQAKP